MKHHTSLLCYAVLLISLLAVNPALQAARTKSRAPQKERAAKTVLPTPQEAFQKHIEQQIANLKDDVYTRATWQKLQEVKQEADNTAANMKLITLSAAGIGFVVGCLAMFLFAKLTGRSEENLKIT